MIFLLSPDEIVRLKKAVNPTSEFTLAVADWLKHLNLFSDAQLYDILKFGQEIIEGLDQDLTAGRTPQYAITLVVSDGRWVTLPGKTCFLDVKYSTELPELENPAITHIACDLIALWHQWSIRKRQNDQFAATHAKAGQFKSND